MTFTWPIILWSLVLIPILAALYMLAQRRRRKYAVRFTNLALLKQVATRRPGIRRHIPPLLYLLGLAALLFSLARPMAVIAVPREQTSVMLVMDVSGSMTADDLEPNRMAAARQAARTFVEELPQTIDVGLVTFNNQAAVQASPGSDRNGVLRSIDSLWASGGTAIGDGLNLALDQLARRPVGENGQRAPGVVVLLSDGQPTDGMPWETAAERAATEGVKVYTVGIGQRGETVMIDGRIPVRLDEVTLQRIAQQTEAQYFYAAESAELEAVYSELGSQISWIEEHTEITALVTAAGAVLLLVAGGLSMLWMQRLP